MQTAAIVGHTCAGQHTAELAVSCQARPGASLSQTIALSDVFARLAAALDADVGVPAIDRRVKAYARPLARAFQAC